MTHVTRIIRGHRVTIRLTDSDGTHYQRRVTWQQLSGMVARLRREGEASIVGIAGIEWGLRLIDTCDGGLGVVLVGDKGEVRIGRAHMRELDAACVAMEGSAA